MDGYLVSAAFILVCAFCISSASVIPNLDLDSEVPKDATKYNIRVTERGATFYEKVEIDEENQIAVFSVPAHNGLLRTDELFDFKTNITVSRSVDEGVCYMKPLPDNIPRPGILNRGLQGLTGLPSNFNINHTSKQWMAVEEVDKMALRQEVREFCPQYPVYRLQEYKPDAVAVEPGRYRRDMKIVMCKQVHPPTHCSPDQWLYQCKISTTSCVYYITCRLDRGKKAICSDFQHLYSSMVCCTPSCP